MVGRRPRARPYLIGCHPPEAGIENVDTADVVGITRVDRRNEFSRKVY